MVSKLLTIVTIAGMPILSRGTFNSRAASPGTMKVGKTVEGGLCTAYFLVHFNSVEIGDRSLVEAELFDLLFHFVFVLVY